MKTNKSYTKRLKVSKNGKIKARKPGLNHFNAKKKTSSKMNIKRGRSVEMSNKSRARFLPREAGK